MEKKKRIYKATREDWIQMGLREIARNGRYGLKIPAVAKHLKATKGSFYWHFKSHEEYVDAILDSFQKTSTEQIITKVDEAVGSAKEQLETLFRLTFIQTNSKNDELELSIRDWARTEKKVYDRIVKIDRMRLDITEKLLKNAGYDRVPERALSIYIYLVGFSLLPTFIPENRDFLKEAKSAVMKFLS